MKKIGVVACDGNNNYGSMLQAYATLVALENLGYDCEFINYQKKTTFSEAVRFLPRFLNMYLMREKWRLLDKNHKSRNIPEVKAGDAARKKAFRRFAESYYRSKISKPYIGYKALQTSSENYDAVLVGSDQLWFPAGLPTNFYNLMFVPDEKKKVAYSTSFGVSKVPFYQKRRTIRYLKRIDYVSVREQSGQNLIKELTGRDVPVVLDPTLLLSSEDWRNVIPEQQVVPRGYILCYLLGSNPEHRKAVKELGKRTELKIYDMPHIDEFVPGDRNFADEHLYDVDPAQFVNLIRHANYICTDSFHCCIFSILYHKKFIAFDRYSDPLMASRNSRISNLCNITGLNNRQYQKDIVKEIQAEPDFEEADQRIEDVKKTSIHYLLNALGW